MNRPRLRHIIATLALVATAAVTAACSNTAPVTPADTTAQSPAAASATLAVSHIHAALRDPKTGNLLAATHEGLYEQTPAGWQRRGPVIDLMGFAIATDGSFYASGHPGIGTDLPQPLGLIHSTDRGGSWTVLSRGGQSDFHALTVAAGTVIGFDGELRTSTDGSTWVTGAIPAAPYWLTANPAGTIVATTETGAFTSDDKAATWTALTTPAPFVVAAFADEDTIVAATADGTLAQSDDAGATWRTGPTPLGQTGAISATRTGDTIEIVAVTEAGLRTTTDLGATTATT